jgi:hypothetical protein
MGSFEPFSAPNTTDHSPERQLWCAVIERAVQDAIDHVGAVSEGPARNRAREEARQWFIENSRDFQKTCDAAGYDPDFLRSRVLRLIEMSSEREAQRNAA